MFSWNLEPKESDVAQNVEYTGVSWNGEQRMVQSKRSIYWHHKRMTEQIPKKCIHGYNINRNEFEDE